MASFRAIHPYVREAAFKHGFIPVAGNPWRVQHPTLMGKKAQVAFYKAFRAACRLPGVRIVATPGAKNGRTILFPQVSQARWDAAREGISSKAGWFGNLSKRFNNLNLFGNLKQLFRLNPRHGL